MAGGEQNTHLNASSRDHAGHKPSRAAPVKLEEWERFKARICELYKEHSLKQVLDVLKDQLGFVVTKRQLIYKLETWGVRKYKVKNVPVVPPDSTDVDSLQGAAPGPAPTRLLGISASKKLAADFCAAVADDGTAFQLYLQLFQSTVNEPGVSPGDRDKLLVSCARSAQSPEDVLTAKRIISERKRHPDNSNHSLLLPVLELYMDMRDESLFDETRNRQQEQVLSQLFHDRSDSGRLLSRLETGDVSAMAHVLYAKKILDQSNTSTISTNSVHQLLNRFASGQPHRATQHRTNGKVQSCLRACLSWCKEQLDSSLAIPQHIDNMYAQDTHCRQRDNLQLFCALWHACIELLEQEGHFPSWCGLCEKDNNISHTDLLLSVSWMLGVEPISSPSVSDHGKSYHIMRRAAINARVLVDWPEKTLWEYFLGVLVWLHEPVSYSRQDRVFEQGYLPQTRAYISSVLQIELPTSKEEQDTSEF